MKVFVADECRRWNVSFYTVYRWIAQGQYRCMKFRRVNQRVIYISGEPPEHRPVPIRRNQYTRLALTRQQHAAAERLVGKAMDCLGRMRHFPFSSRVRNRLERVLLTVERFDSVRATMAIRD